MTWAKITRPDYDRRHGRHASDLTDREWGLVAAFMPTRRRTGRPRTTGLRDVLDAICGFHKYRTVISQIPGHPFQ